MGVSSKGNASLERLYRFGMSRIGNFSSRCTEIKLHRYGNMHSWQRFHLKPISSELLNGAHSGILWNSSQRYGMWQHISIAFADTAACKTNTEALLIWCGVARLAVRLSSCLASFHHGRRSAGPRKDVFRLRRLHAYIYFIRLQQALFMCSDNCCSIVSSEELCYVK